LGRNFMSGLPSSSLYTENYKPFKNLYYNFKKAENFFFRKKRRFLSPVADTGRSH